MKFMPLSQDEPEILRWVGNPEMGGNPSRSPGGCRVRIVHDFGVHREFRPAMNWESRRISTPGANVWQFGGADRLELAHLTISL
jgi:hypothetical protein